MELDELERAAKRHEKRRKRFVEEGLSEDEAYDLAEKLFDRDRDTMDDRRLCFECSNYARISVANQSYSVSAHAVNVFFAVDVV